MSGKILRLLRMWLVIHVSLNIISMSAYFILQSYKSGHQDDETSASEYHFEPLYWFEIIFSVILFFAYIYSFFGKRVLTKRKRAALMGFPSLVLFGFNALLVDFERRRGGGYYSWSGRFGKGATRHIWGPFDCEPGVVVCRLRLLTTMLSFLLGLLALIEICMSYKWGTHQAKNPLYTSQGYNPNAQVIIVSPLTQQQPGGPVYVSPQNLYYQQQQPYQQQPYQQQQQQQQASHLVGPLSADGSIEPQQQYQQQEFKGFAQPAPIASPDHNNNTLLQRQ